MNKKISCTGCTGYWIFKNQIMAFRWFWSSWQKWSAKKGAFNFSHCICSIEILNNSGKMAKIIDFATWDYLDDTATQHLKLKFLSHGFCHNSPMGFPMSWVLPYNSATDGAMGFAMDTSVGFPISWVLPYNSTTAGTMGFAMDTSVGFPISWVLSYPIQLLLLSMIQQVAGKRVGHHHHHHHFCHLWRVFLFPWFQGQWLTGRPTRWLTRWPRR